MAYVNGGIVEFTNSFEIGIVIYLFTSAISLTVQFNLYAICPPKK